MDARKVWKQFAQSEEGRQLAALLSEAESDQLKKQGELDRRINAAFQKLTERVDKTVYTSDECVQETFYRSRYFDDHVELTTKLPVEMVLELADMLGHYEDHNCEEAAHLLDAYLKALILMMMESVPQDVVARYVIEGEDDDE